MKKILLSILLFLNLSTVAMASIVDGQFGINQIFDVQYYWSGSTLNASNFIAPYSQNFQTVTATSGQYFKFIDNNNGSYGLGLYNSDGSLSQTVHSTGTITALGSGAIFYIGSGFFGNVISTAQGYNYGASASFTEMDTDVTAADLTAYTYASSTPLAAGQTASPGSNTGGNTGGGGSVVTPSYASSITAPQLLSRSSALLYTTGNNAQITINGSSNDVDLRQLTAGNYADIGVTGAFNDVTTLQVSTTSARHYLEMDILGNNNLVNVDQKDASKTLFAALDGDYNTVDILQQGAGRSYIDLNISGDDAIVDIVQQGAGDHAATIDLENAGGTWDFSLVQNSDTNLVYSLPHNLSDNSVVTGICYTGVCNINIVQEQ